MDFPKIKIIIVLVLLNISVFSQAIELVDIYDQILITYSTIKTCSMDFLQENYWKEIDTFQQSKGKIYYDKDHFLIDYSEPAEQKLLVENDTYTIYEPSIKQAMITDNKKVELNPEKFISHYWDISEKELIEEEDDFIKIKLITPRNESIFLSLSNFYLIDVLIIAPTEDSVHYSFDNQKYNIDLADNIFEINFPDDTNIIDSSTPKNKNEKGDKK